MVTFAPPVRRVCVPVARPQDYLRPGGLRGYEVVEYDTATFTYATTATTTMTSGDGYHWYPTTTATTTATAAFNPQVWHYWMNDFTVAADRAAGAMRQTAEELREIAEQQREAIERQRDAMQQRREEQSRRILAEQERMKGARERAVALFTMLLTSEELDDWKGHGRQQVKVQGQDGTLFLIGTRDSVHGNVVEVDEHGCHLGTVCVAPDMLDREAGVYLPLADGWIGQLMAIRHDLEHFRARGNWSRRHGCRQAPAAVPLAA